MTENGGIPIGARGKSEFFGPSNTFIASASFRL
jgi:hypothetical protein